MASDQSSAVLSASSASSFLSEENDASRPSSDDGFRGFLEAMPQRLIQTRLNGGREGEVETCAKRTTPSGLA